MCIMHYNVPGSGWGHYMLHFFHKKKNRRKETKEKKDKGKISMCQARRFVGKSQDFWGRNQGDYR